MNQSTATRGEQMLEKMIQNVERSIVGKPDYAMRILALAEDIASQGHSVRAYRLCQQAAAFDPADGRVSRRARGLLNRLVPGYHIPMMNDERRNGAWDKALRAAVRPGSKVLEIGTGAGMLALMAARAGAAKVTTCEFHYVVAQVARDIVAKNGYADKITVLAKASNQMKLGVDLDERADLLFCDNFSDNFFSFQPLHSIADARARLLKPGAPCLPARAAVKIALADWDTAESFFRVDQACGFDISPARLLPSESVDLEIGDRGMRLRSADCEIFRFDFADSTFPLSGAVDVDLEVQEDGVIGGVAQWIRLELDDENFLEARPEPGSTFFSNPRFHPFDSPLQVKRGQTLRIHARHDGRGLQIWHSGPSQ